MMCANASQSPIKPALLTMTVEAVAEALRLKPGVMILDATRSDADVRKRMITFVIAGPEFVLPQEGQLLIHAEPAQVFDESDTRDRTN